MLTLVRKSIDIKTPVDNVFTYFARPEHVSDQIKNDTVGMTVVPMDIKEGWVLVQLLELSVTLAVNV